jgi:hypothetical protein
MDDCAFPFVAIARLSRLGYLAGSGHDDANGKQLVQRKTGNPSTGCRVPSTGLASKGIITKTPLCVYNAKVKPNSTNVFSVSSETNPAECPALIELAGFGGLVLA